MDTIDDILENVDNEFMEDIIKKYNVKYEMLEGIKGCINIRERYILVDPCYNDEDDTLMHELMHHYLTLDKGILFPNCSNMEEELVERCAQRYLKVHPEFRNTLKNYLK